MTLFNEGTHLVKTNLPCGPQQVQYVQSVYKRRQHLVKNLEQQIQC